MATSTCAIPVTGLGRAVKIGRISSPRFRLGNEVSINGIESDQEMMLSRQTQ